MAYPEPYYSSGRHREDRRDAKLAYDGQPASLVLATMVHTEGLSYLLRANPAADLDLVRAYEGPPPSATPCRSPRWCWPKDASWPPSTPTGREVTALARRAVRIVDTGGFEDY